MLGAPYLTTSEDAHRVTEPGMAHFAGSGPPGKTCKDCAFKGYRRPGNAHFDPVKNDYVVHMRRTGGCAKFRELSGNHGLAIKGTCRACKYFEQKAKP